MSDIKNTVNKTIDLLPSEQIASDFVQRIGLQRAYRVLDKLSQRFNRRYRKACEKCFVSIDQSWVRETPFERKLTHKLKIGITLNDDYNTPYAARQRNIARHLARKEARKQRSAANI
ncbi:hypothetical protein [Photobacterium damselae]|uniref:hypothetical protein n=1 Tax=Photobacterium damselae TaxID=38293 RepID=UPI001F3AE755|nr:hypothetical protein [Photobacterium damselae]UKA04745.1 hypothetical protein IHC89_21120 [Photobacterium damselae subsp. damselae]